MNTIDQLWETLLSRDPSLIQRTYKQLAENDKKSVKDHLLKMATVTGWHLEQKRSAQAAIDAIMELD